MRSLFKALLLLLVSQHLYANSLLDGKYSFVATVKEANSNESYKFKMNLTVQSNIITGDVDYTQDGCAGTLTGKVVSKDVVKISENITKGSDICNNGVYVLELKYQLISKIKNYLLDGNRHSVTINNYNFTPNTSVWDESALYSKINETKIAIEELEYDTYRPQRLIEKALQKQALSKEFLEHNTTLFHNGSCEKPPLAPKPEPFFKTREKAKKYALAYCSVSFGCRVGVELARDKLDTAAKRFLASQSCTMLVRTYQKENTLLDETAFNLLDAVSYEGCEDGGEGFLGGLMQGGSCVMSAVTRLARVGQYIGCIDSQTQAFHNSYLDWKNEPRKKQKECMVHFKIVDDTPKIVEKYNKQLEMIQSKINSLNTKFVVLTNKMKNILFLRNKQISLIKEFSTR